jgi:hypothetical protein
MTSASTSAERLLPTRPHAACFCLTGDTERGRQYLDQEQKAAPEPQETASEGQE